MKKLLAGLVLAAMTMLAVPQQAAALSLLNPLGAASKHLSENNGMVEEVRFGRGRGGFGRGHFRGFRSFRGHRGFRVHRGWRPRHFAPRFYVAPPRRCRIVLTYYGPQRVCRYRWY